MGNRAERLIAQAHAERGQAAAPRRLLRRAQPYLLLAPAVCLVLVITVYPLADLVSTAFHSTQYFQVGAFSGFDNFRPLFSAGGARSFAASALFVLASDVLSLGIALFLALVMEAPLRGRGLLRTLVMLPWLISLVVTGLLWQALLDPNFGPLVRFARFALGWSIAPLSHGPSAMGSLILANVWRSYPFALVLILAALQSIPAELYEAARLDGASRWGELRHVALPLVGRTAAVALILLTFEYFTLVTLPFILTGGGPDEATYVLSLRTWREAFTDYRFGASAATGVVVFLLNLGLSAVYIRRFIFGEARDVPG